MFHMSHHGTRNTPVGLYQSQVDTGTFSGQGLRKQEEREEGENFNAHDLTKVRKSSSAFTLPLCSLPLLSRSRARAFT